MQIKSDLSLVLFTLISCAALGLPNPQGRPLEAPPPRGPQGSPLLPPPPVWSLPVANTRPPLWKDGAWGRLLLGGAVPGGLRGAPGARTLRGRLGAAGGDPGLQRLPAAGPAYETECNGETVIYMKMEFPFLLSNRDCVYVQQRRELDFRGRKIQVVLAKGTSMPQFPERSDFIRVRQCQVKLAMESDGSNRSKVLIHCFINPGGIIPSWIINLVAKVRPPEAGGEVCLTDIDLACGAV
uniref:Phosphatidylcholine transfer protein n=1 Tax=Capra hircus TaxID=9925 RepID=A0A8C2PLF7_CAPHI